MMSAETIAAGFIVALAIAFVGGGVAHVRRAGRARDALRRHGALAEGEVTRVLREPSGAYLVRYCFTPAGARQPLTRDEYVGYLDAEVPEVGAKLPVRYDPQAPERSLIARET